MSDWKLLNRQVTANAEAFHFEKEKWRQSVPVLDEHSGRIDKLNLKIVPALSPKALVKGIRPLYFVSTCVN